MEILHNPLDGDLMISPTIRVVLFRDNACCLLLLTLVISCLLSGAKRLGLLQHLPGAGGQRPGVERAGPFLDEKLLLWQEFTVLDIPSGLSSIGCCSITSTASWRNTRAGSRRSMVSSARSSRRWSSATSIAATPAAGLPASAVQTVARNDS